MRAKRLAASHPCLLPLAASILICLSARSQAATVLVNDASEGSVPGKCTLADAVIAVNTAAPKNACAAGNGSSDTIDLSVFTSPTTISFTVPSALDPNSALAVTKAVAINAGLDGSGNPLVTLTRSSAGGTPNFRMIGTTANLTLRGLHLSNGAAADLGGAVSAAGTAAVSLTNSIISGNTAVTSGGGVAVDCGQLYLKNSVVSDNNAGQHGAGLYASNYQPGGGHCSPLVTLKSSTISGNHATSGNGGGIYSFYGSVVGSYVTIDANTAGGSKGGGVYAYIGVSLFNSTVSNNSIGMNGGGIYTQNAVNLTNTTVAGNIAYEAGALMSYRVSLFFSTIAGNSAQPQNYPLGGIRCQQTCLLVSTIVSGNMGDQIKAGTLVTGNHDLIGSNPSGLSVSLPNDTINCNPTLGPLADNGGLTKTRALGDGSCAIDAGPQSTSGYPSDQRGRKFARWIGASTDIGAYEVQSNERIFYDGFDT